MPCSLNTCYYWVDEVVQKVKIKEFGYLTKIVCKIGIPTKLFICYIPKYKNKEKSEH